MYKHMPLNWSFPEKDSFQVLHPFSSTIELSVGEQDLHRQEQHVPSTWLPTWAHSHSNEVLVSWRSGQGVKTNLCELPFSEHCHPCHSTSQTAQPLSRSCRAGRTSACESQSKWSQTQWPDQYWGKHDMLYIKEHCRRHLTIIPTLTPETGNEIFIHLDMIDGIEATIHVKNGTC